MHNKIGSVFSQLYQSPSGIGALAFRSAGVSAAVAVLVSGTGAIAASNQVVVRASGSGQPMQLAQSTTNSQPDVVIDGNPQNSGSTTTSPSSGNATSLNQVRFACEQVSGQYTVMYHPQSQPNQSFAWATPSAMGTAWSPERRCNEISRRLESYRPDGLVELRTDVENGYNTVCVTTEAVPSCRIVFTVPPGQDPVATRDRVFQNLTVADSGQSTQGVNTFAGGRNGGSLNQVLNNLGLGSILGGKNNTQSRYQGIYLKPFLDRNDGGTAVGLSQLKKTRVTTPSNGRRLNPGRF